MQPGVPYNLNGWRETVTHQTFASVKRPSAWTAFKVLEGWISLARSCSHFLKVRSKMNKSFKVAQG
jgi:hypothetical protein